MGTRHRSSTPTPVPPPPSRSPVLLATTRRVSREYVYIHTILQTIILLHVSRYAPEIGEREEKIGFVYFTRRRSLERRNFSAWTNVSGIINPERNFYNRRPRFYLSFFERKVSEISFRLSFERTKEFRLLLDLPSRVPRISHLFFSFWTVYLENGG